MTPRQAGGIALVLVVMSVFLIAVFQTVELVQNRRVLERERDRQQPVLEQTAKLRGQIESLASDVAGLADQGDAAAKTVLDTLRHQGVSFTPRRP